MQSTIKRIKKRNGELVDFDAGKIQKAIEKAFIAQEGSFGDASIKDILNAVVENLTMTEGDLSVEKVQDVVENVLMKKGFFKVAKAYILYRHEHSKLREKKEDVAEKIEKKELFVTKKSGTKEAFNLDKLKKTLMFAVGDMKEVDVDRVLDQCRSELYDEISTKDVERTLLMTLRSMIEKDPAYSRVAANVLLDVIYKEVFGKVDYKNLKKQHIDNFKKNIKNGVDAGRLDKRLLDFDLDLLVGKINLENDKLFEYMGLEVLYNRYLVKDTDTNKVIETPQMLWLRTAIGTAILENDDKKNEIAEAFYGIMSDFSYTPGGRTLFMSGTPRPQLSSCFLNTVPDSLDEIFNVFSDNAQLLKWSGGLGTDWTSVRATGAFIKGTGVGSQGVIPFLKIANDVTVSINRGGKRRGAACVYLETWHMDIMDFLELRKNTGDERRRTHDISTANWIPDLFMKRVREGKDWTLFSPEEVPELHDLYGKAFDEKYEEYEKKALNGELKLTRTMPAKDLWRKMINMLFETGHPWITFKDPSNIRSPQDHVGVVHNSNLCTEITLNTSRDETAVCNLGSVNFAKFVKDGKFDSQRAGEVVKIAIRMLDNVVDINFYPTENSKRANLKHRPLGLGVRGFQDALYMLGIDFASEECVEFADSSMELISYHSILASSELAKEKGTYETYKGSKWDRGILPQDTLDLLEKERGVKIDVKREGELDWAPVRESIKKYGMRNSNCLALAPTASTANLVGCVPSVEPIYKNLYVKSNKEGNFIVVNKYLAKDLKKKGMWSEELLEKIKFHDGSIQNIDEIPKELRDKYKEVFEIDSRWLIKSAAYRAKWIDQSQSLNIFYKGTSGRDISDIYMYAWEMGLKTTYYLRTLAVSQVEKSTLNTKEHGSTHIRGKFKATSAKATEKAREEIKIENAVSKQTTGVPKLCSVLDPECESCGG